MALEQLRTEQLGYGIVCDEFGVTQGIVTLKDIFEALVGELLEDREEPDIVVREDGSVLVDGQCSFYDFLAHFGLEDVYSSAEYNTISGLILDEVGTYSAQRGIPSMGVFPARSRGYGRSTHRQGAGDDDRHVR